MSNAHVTWAFMQMSMSSFVQMSYHILMRRVRGQNYLKTKSDLLPESREQSGVGGVGREKERGGAVARRGGGKIHLEGGHLAPKLRGQGSRFYLLQGPQKPGLIYSWFPKI